MSPIEAARALLLLPDPLPTLERWSRADPREAAPRLHALVGFLKAGEPSLIGCVPLDLSLGDMTAHLDVLLLPSIFAPEAWSYTFLEGLLRKPITFYRGKRLLEIGAGSGWISLALLRLTGAAAACGVDLNPHAALIARLNAVLNGYDAEGREADDRLASRFVAYESDVLSTPLRLGLRADVIVGCIPQVMITRADLASTQGLHDLSNYTTAQGLAEDQFGLGLNARALREALRVLSPGGSVVLNLAGRPGPSVVSGMFRRRGYTTEVLWRTRVMQASDTDIRPLVDLEAASGRTFAFHLHRHSPETISARLAQAALNAKRPIYHELQVIEGRPCSEALLPLARDLEALGLGDLWERVDLTAASDEQLSFVARLAEVLLRSPHIPETPVAGSLVFRRRLAGFLRKFHGIELTESDTFIGSTRANLLQGLLAALVKPGERVVVSAVLREVYERVLEAYGADPVWVHGDGDEVAEILPWIRPRLVLLSALGPIRSRSEVLERLRASCLSMDILLILDESDHFDITADRDDNPILDFLERHIDCAHLAVLIGLVRSQAFPDVELGLFVNRNPDLHRFQGRLVAITDARVSWFHEAYYEALFDDLLNFSINVSPSSGAAPFRSGPKLFRSPEALDGAPLFADEGEAPSPPSALSSRVLSAIVWGFMAPYQSAAQAYEAAQDAAQRAATAYVSAMGCPVIGSALLGQSVAALWLDALRGLHRVLRRRPRIAFLPGSHAPAGVVSLAGCDLVRLEREESSAAGGSIANVPEFDLLVVPHPPALSESEDALDALIQVSRAQGARCLAVGGPTLYHRFVRSRADAQTLWIWSASKEFSAPGLGLAVIAGGDADWLTAMDAQDGRRLPQHSLVMARALFEGPVVGA